VRDQQRRRGAFGPDALQLQVEALPQHVVQGAERLVEQQHLRLDDQRPGNRHPLLHAARQLRGPGLLKALQADQLDQVSDLIPGGPDARDLQRQPDVGGDVAPGQQARVLEGDAKVVLVPRHRRLLAMQERRTRGRRLQPSENAQHRRLAAAGGPEQGQERALRGLQVHTAQGGKGFAAQLELLRQAGQADAIRQEKGLPCRHRRGSRS
jgi:hypothetical protein